MNNYADASSDYKLESYKSNNDSDTSTDTPVHFKRRNNRNNKNKLARNDEELNNRVLRMTEMNLSATDFRKLHAAFSQTSRPTIAGRECVNKAC